MRSQLANTDRVPRRPRRVGDVMRRAGGLLCLFAFLVSTSGVLPALAAGLAHIDPQHRVLVERGEEGLRIVLNHSDARCHHQHHLPARVLMLIAARQTNPAADHVLSFGGVSTQEEACAAVVAPTPEQSHAPAPVATPALFVVEPEVIRPRVAEAPPDSPPAVVMIVRSTTRQI